MTKYATASTSGKLRLTFQSPYEQLADRIGEPFKLLYEVPHDDPNIDYEETGPLYVICFDRDGMEIWAWPEEVFDIL